MQHVHARTWQRAGAGALLLTGLGVLPVAPAFAAHRQTATAPTSCATLASGAQGAAVATLQAAIGTGVDGGFGPKTQAALKTWQTKHHLAATGHVDAATWAALPTSVAQSACGEAVKGSGVSASCASLSNGDSGLAVEVLQRAVGTAADGAFGPQTRDALEAAQRKASVKATGTTNAATWQAIGLGGSPVCTTGTSAASTSSSASGGSASGGSGSGGSGSGGSGSGSGSGGSGSGGSGSGSSDAPAQATLRARTLRRVATLERTSGTTTDKVALAAMSYAMHQLGKPYRYGGVGPSSYDCSGLTMSSYEHAALTLPRTAADQYAGGGKRIRLDQVRQGDLLFYADDLTQPSTIHHVVMYVGDGQVVEAPYTGVNVRIVPLFTSGLLPIAVRPTAKLTLPLKAGATGWSVRQLQQALDRHGASVSVDGGFGAQTAAAVRSWQVRHSLHATGIVHTPTWLSLG